MLQITVDGSPYAGEGLHVSRRALAQALDTSEPALSVALRNVVARPHAGQLWLPVEDQAVARLVTQAKLGARELYSARGAESRVPASYEAIRSALAGNHLFINGFNQPLAPLADVVGSRVVRQERLLKGSAVVGRGGWKAGVLSSRATPVILGATGLIFVGTRASKLVGTDIESPQRRQNRQASMLAGTAAMSGLGAGGFLVATRSLQTTAARPVPPGLRGAAIGVGIGSAVLGALAVHDHAEIEPQGAAG